MVSCAQVNKGASADEINNIICYLAQANRKPEEYNWEVKQNDNNVIIMVFVHKTPRPGWHFMVIKDKASGDFRIIEGS